MPYRDIPQNNIGQNAGLALSRFVPWVGESRSQEENKKEQKKRRRTFFKDVTRISADDTYKTAFQRWQQATEARNALRITATLVGPLAVGLGNESPYEVGLTLHRIYGMPYIPGSAIKGACRRALAKQPEGIQQSGKKLFGDTDEAGYCIFHDAWFDPASVTGKPLMLDTVTVHHPDYYQNKGKVFATDFDDPTPIPFISVRPGAKFLFALEIPDVEPENRAHWLKFTEHMLYHTLTEIGIGGKTNAGYGWFNEFVAEHPPVVLSREQQLAIERAIADEKWTKLKSAIDAITDASKLGGETIPLLEKADTPDLKRQLAQALKERAEKLRRWNKDTVDKPWRKAIEEAL